MILCDTNILIEFYKGNTEIADGLRKIGVPNLAVSVVTVGELYFGARDKRELGKIKKHLASLTQIPIDDEVSNIFLELLEDYSLSHRLSIPDAMIAASALRHGLELYTLNLKDFRFVENLKLYGA